MTDKKRKVYQVNPYERKILMTIFIFAGLPVIIIILFFFAIFSDLIYTYVDSGLAGHFIDRFLMLAGLMVVYYAFFARLVFRFTHRIAGGYQRILREIDEVLTGSSKKHLHLREGDYSGELIDKINQLIDKLS